ncbi:transcriptional regulation of mitochondrial recombination-domain-containing protein [Xylariomycetidae sp. FL2044]|nr:transcriptional regulation of mitochondrial recombination-domain-containing protein [Xylariomycetidae sp. FL2044]
MSSLLGTTSITGQLSRLSIGISQMSIRLKSKSARRSAAKAAAKKRNKKSDDEPNKPPGPYAEDPHHGEKIWVFNDILSGLTLYSHSSVIKASRALRQILWTPRKVKPSKFRRDRWRPMAVIQFPTGLGPVGLSAYQRLRECKTLHALAWRDDKLVHRSTGRPLDRGEREQRLVHDQKAETVADMAAVLEGLGKGTKVVTRMTEDEYAGAFVGTPREDDYFVPKDAEGRPVTNAEGLVVGLVRTQIFWVDELDKGFAPSWSPSVTHAALDSATYEPIEPIEPEVIEELENGDDGSNGDGGATVTVTTESAAEGSKNKEAETEAPPPASKVVTIQDPPKKKLRQEEEQLL